MCAHGTPSGTNSLRKTPALIVPAARPPVFFRLQVLSVVIPDRQTPEALAGRRPRVEELLRKVVIGGHQACTFVAQSHDRRAGERCEVEKDVGAKLLGVGEGILREAESSVLSDLSRRSEKAP